MFWGPICDKMGRARVGGWVDSQGFQFFGLLVTSAEQLFESHCSQAYPEHVCTNMGASSDGELGRARLGVVHTANCKAEYHMGLTQEPQHTDPHLQKSWTDRHILITTCALPDVHISKNRGWPGTTLLPSGQLL